MSSIQMERRRIIPRVIQGREHQKTREEMMINALSPNLTIMVRAVRKVGRRMVRDFGEVSSLQVSQKGPGDFVSNADLLAEKTLIEQLSTDRPDYGFITEENGVIPARNNSPFTWVIDPIDGTINFLHAIPVFSISVALIENKDVIAGVTYNPITNELYYAEKGKGSYLMTPTGNVRLRVSGRTKSDYSLIGSNGFNSSDNRTVVSKLASSVSSVRYNGSTTLSLASVAAGQFEAYVSTSFKLWDLAVGYLLVKEAGGYVSDFEGSVNLMDIVNKQEVIVSNSSLKKFFLNLIQK